MYRVAHDTYKLCGVQGERYVPNPKEKEDLTALQRGVFAKCKLSAGDKLGKDDFYLAFPRRPDQLSASDLSKYYTIKIKHDSIASDAPILISDVEITDDTPKVQNILTSVFDLIDKSGVVIPVNSTCEISHHYGLDRFSDVGVTIINCINREYCKKILIVLPGQSNPEHMHRQKEETFTVLYGDLTVTCKGVTQVIRKGESKIVERGVFHKFRSDMGCVFEEISTTHNENDSFYGLEKEHFVNPRKTKIYITEEVLERAK